MYCVLKRKNVSKTIYNSSMNLDLEKKISRRFSLDCWGVVGVKICLEISFGALEYMLQLYDKLEEFWVQGPSPRRSNAALKWWIGIIGVLSAKESPGAQNPPPRRWRRD